MRVFFATTALLGLGLIGYASLGGATAHGQVSQFVVMPGEKVILRFNPPDGAVRECTILATRGDFVQCEVTSQPGLGEKSPERWVNLRVVAFIDKPARQE